jgi:hypothetical protein
VPGATSNDLCRIPAICGIAICGETRCGAVPDVQDTQGLPTLTAVKYDWEQSAGEVAAGSWTEVTT